MRTAALLTLFIYLNPASAGDDARKRLDAQIEAQCRARLKMATDELEKMKPDYDAVVRLCGVSTFAKKNFSHNKKTLLIGLELAARGWLVVESKKGYPSNTDLWRRQFIPAVRGYASALDLTRDERNKLIEGWRKEMGLPPVKDDN